jgi:hypothetical protein
LVVCAIYSQFTRVFIPGLLVGVNKHKHWDHRQDEDHAEEENDEQIDSEAGKIKTSKFVECRFESWKK